MPSPMHPQASVDAATFEWLKVTTRSAVSAEFAESIHPEIVRDEVWGQLIYQLRAHVLAERLPAEVVRESKTFVFEVPASPWQQFKASHSDRLWLRWLVRRRPVRMVQHVRRADIGVDVSRFWSYPEARVSTELGRPVRVMMFDPQVDWIEPA